MSQHKEGADGGAGKVAGNENKMKKEHQQNRENMTGNQTKMMHTGKMGEHGQQHAMNQMQHNQMQHNQMQRNQQMRNAQMGGKHPQMQGGGNRQPKGQQQQQGKKKNNH